jgi:hypothetical protein
VSWDPLRIPAEPGFRGGLVSNRGVGLVHGGLSLIPGRTVLEHLLLFYAYHLTGSRQELLLRAARLLRNLCPPGEWRELCRLQSERLTARQRRLGLCALAMAKEPWLYVLARPLRLLGREFHRLWGLLERERAERGCACLILGTPSEGYAPVLFDSVAELGRGIPEDPWDEAG